MNCADLQEELFEANQRYESLYSSYINAVDTLLELRKELNHLQMRVVELEKLNNKFDLNALLLSE